MRRLPVFSHKVGFHADFMGWGFALAKPHLRHGNSAIHGAREWCENTEDLRFLPGFLQQNIRTDAPLKRRLPLPVLVKFTCAALC
jgi:hypothetical protein